MGSFCSKVEKGIRVNVELSKKKGGKSDVIVLNCSEKRYLERLSKIHLLPDLFLQEDQLSKQCMQDHLHCL